MFDPAESISAGTSMLVVRPTFRPPALQTATVQRAAGPVLAMILPLGEDLDKGEEVLLVFHVAGVRLAGAARFVAREGHVVTFHLDGSWRPVDARAHHRFPAAHSATLTAAGEPGELAATITDVSPSGLGLHTPSAPAVLDLVLTLTLRGQAASLRCWVVASKEVAEGFRVSLSYADLDDESQAFADRLYDFYRDAFDGSIPLAG